jgi:hypothetical protein
MDIDKDDGDKQHAGDDEELPPFLGSWNRLYGAIIIYTCVLILSLYLMTLVLNR